MLILLYGSILSERLYGSILSERQVALCSWKERGVTTVFCW